MPIVSETVMHNVSVYWEGEATCQLNIKVVLKLYETGKEYYDVSYKWIYDKRDPTNHPFHGDHDFLDEHQEGDIIFRNPISDALIAGLVMENSELENISGTSIAKDYRYNIIKSLSLFWD